MHRLPALARRQAPAWVAAMAFSLFLNVLAMAGPLYMLQVYDRVLTSRSLETLALLTLIALGALAAMAWLDSIRMQLVTRAAARLEAEAAPIVLRQTVVQAQAAGPRYPHGLRDLRAIRHFLGGNGVLAFVDVPWCPVFLVLIALFSPAMGWLALAGVVSLLLLVGLDERVTRRQAEAAGHASRHASEQSDEAVRNAEVVIALGMSRAVEHRTARAYAEAAGAHLGAHKLASRILALSKFCRQALQVAMLGLGAWLVLRQEVSPGVMVAATVLLSRAMAPVESSIAGWRSMQEARLAWWRLARLLDGPASAARVPLPAPLGRVMLERVYVAIGRQAPILKNLTLGIEAGELVGVIGPSGAGKTTLARLLVGLLQPSAGAVRLDGAAYDQWEADALGARLGYLPQDVQLFDGTVAQNIARLQESPADSTAVVQAARLAGAHELILRLPDGYQTRVGPQGAVLSAGQRQLVGLARALYGEPALVVLDEPNANLDGAGEDRLLAALQALRARHATVVMVTHRPSLLRDADKVLLLKGGEVADFGPRDAVFGKVASVSAIAPVSPPGQRAGT